MINEGGKHPIWNQNFEIGIKSMDDNIIFKCMDEDLVCDEIIGEAQIKISKLI